MKKIYPNLCPFEFLNSSCKYGRTCYKVHPIRLEEREVNRSEEKRERNFSPRFDVCGCVFINQSCPDEERDPRIHADNINDLCFYWANLGRCTNNKCERSHPDDFRGIFKKSLCTVGFLKGMCNREDCNFTHPCQ